MKITIVVDAEQPVADEPQVDHRLADRAARTRPAPTSSTTPTRPDAEDQSATSSRRLGPSDNAYIKLARPAPASRNPPTSKLPGIGLAVLVQEQQRRRSGRSIPIGTLT